MMKNTIFLLLFVFALFACEDDDSVSNHRRKDWKLSLLRLQVGR